MKGKIYFASDLHLGIPNRAKSLEREKLFINWLDHVSKDASTIFLVGDLFDFWFEYKTVVPRGYVRLLGKLAELQDKGIELIAFTGNHDMWQFGYLEEEIGLKLYRDPHTWTWNGKKFLIGHGDGLGPGDHGYKFLKKVFRNRICQELFGFLHPNIGMGIANFFSRRSRLANGIVDETYLGPDKEWLAIYCNEVIQKEHFDYFVFGHRHLPLDLPIGENSRYINLGDWMQHFTYAVFDGNTLELKKWENQPSV